jgi:hypothetical protein
MLQCCGYSALPCLVAGLSAQGSGLLRLQLLCAMCQTLLLSCLTIRDALLQGSCLELTAWLRLWLRGPGCCCCCWCTSTAFNTTVQLLMLICRASYVRPAACILRLLCNSCRCLGSCLHPPWLAMAMPCQQEWVPQDLTNTLQVYRAPISSGTCSTTRIRGRHIRHSMSGCPKSPDFCSPGTLPSGDTCVQYSDRHPLSRVFSPFYALSCSSRGAALFDLPPALLALTYPPELIPIYLPGNLQWFPRLPCLPL